MSQVRLELDQLTDDEVQTLIETHIAEMTNNANFPTPDPSVADFAAATNPFLAAKLAAEQARQAALEATQLRETARAQAAAALTARGAYVQTKSGGDAAKILSSGFGVRDQPAPIGPLPAPVDFLPTIGDEPGEIDVTWSAVRGARSYVLEHKEQAGTGGWTTKVVTKSRQSVTGLTSGTVYVFRVAAVGTAGQSPWSIEVARRAP